VAVHNSNICHSATAERLHYEFQINSYLSLHGALSYKSAGFVEGIVAQSGFIWEAGFSFNLPLKDVA